MRALVRKDAAGWATAGNAATAHVHFHFHFHFHKTVPSLRTQGVDFLEILKILAQNHEKIFLTKTYPAWNFS